ncbi:MAG: phosphate starvation-inducible protein PsiF [Sulfuriferula sp.]|nr:phosphate starvation-inducible protein PsiF [Sulfuriferula sp.]
MNKVLAALVMSAVLSAMSVSAFAKTAQQEKMGTCNKDAAAKALKGDERKAFMKSCLSAKPAEVTAPAADAKPQNAMTSCNKAADGKKGDERKKFMSSCLSAKGPENMK